MHGDVPFERPGTHFLMLPDGVHFRVLDSLKMTANRQRNPQDVCLYFKELHEDDLPL